MESGLVWRVLLALGMLARGGGGSGWEYQVHGERVRYSKALEGCSGAGGLAELSTQREVARVLSSVAAVAPPQGSTGPRGFWVGLRKTERSCVIPHLPLKGFSWLSDDGGERWEGPERWWSPPEQTCTAERCGLLQVLTDGSTPPRWGLLARPCRDAFAFICRRNTSSTMETTLTPTPTPTSTTSTSTTTTSTTTTTAATTTSATAAPGPGAGPGPSEAPGTRPCVTPSSPRFRWLRRDPEDGGVLTVLCWSKTRLELRCLDGRWSLDGAAVDPDAVCAASPPPTPSPSGAGQEASQAVEAGTLVTVLAAVGALVALVVLVVVAVLVVKCCLARRSKDRAVRKAEKMAMKNNEPTNEKARR